ncbi:esterase/lipase family protein [Ramlibacter montanisoli]|uniref:Alpha/beta hydrolase n=1 Tax=Ramlibacter montanisoli TaxID=2732512 RepID=A0A849KAW2_9BURK|nr:alpha/beta hydrolase [Ramlibacter montanisoli]
MSPSRPAAPSAGKRPLVRIADLRGSVRLAVDGVQGVTHIAEGLHGNIARLAPPLGTVAPRPAGGIAGFVYRTVRGTSGLVGLGLDALLAGVQRMLQQPAEGDATVGEGPRRQAILAALNGVLGDHLARTGNPLAIPMELVVRGPPRPRVLLLVHGLCMSDGQWLRGGHDHGTSLARSLDCTPVYLRYNSGRHVSQNAAELAAKLQELVARWPMPLESLAIVGHSMGGLVARSAVRQALEAGMAWPGLLRKMVFLGTPHQGAALERAGNWLHTVLGVSPYLAPFSRLGRLRSDGITDLRHGNLLESDWRSGRFAHRDTRTPVALPQGVACYAIAGALGKGRDPSWGDGLVSVASALGRHPRATHDLHLPASRTWVARGVHHLDLLASEAACRKMRVWLS